VDDQIGQMLSKKSNLIIRWIFNGLFSTKWNL